MLLLYYAILLSSIGLSLKFLEIDLKKYNPSSIFWLSLLATLLIPSLSDPFEGYIQPHPYSISYTLDIATLIEAHAFVLLFLLIFFSAQHLPSLKNTERTSIKPHFIEQKLSNDSSGMHWLLAFLFLSIYGVIEAYSKFGVRIFSDFGFTERREQLSFLSGFLLSYNLTICAGTLFWLVHQKKHLASFFVVSAYFLLYFVMGGSRQPITILALPFVFYFLFSSKNKITYSIIIAVSFSLISRLFEFFTYLRNLPGLDARLDALSNLTDFLFFYQERLGSSESSLRFAFYYFVQIGLTERDFGELNYLIRLLFFWLPSSIDFLNIKPMDFEYTMFSSFMPGQIGTLHPTFFGSIYADSGWLAIPWVAFFIATYKSSSWILKKYNGISFFAIWGLYAYLYMMMARGALYGPFVVLIFGLIFVKLAHQFTFNQKSRPSN